MWTNVIYLIYMRYPISDRGYTYEIYKRQHQNILTTFINRIFVILCFVYLLSYHLTNMYIYVYVICTHTHTHTHTHTYIYISL